MRVVARLFRLPKAQLASLFLAICLMILARLVIWTLPFSATRRFILDEATHGMGAVAIDHVVVDRVVWALNKVSRNMPWAATCLTRALCARIMLGREGQRTELRLGVARRDDGGLSGHAWLEAGGVVIVGEEGDPSSFTRVPPLKAGLS